MTILEQPARLAPDTQVERGPTREVLSGGYNTLLRTVLRVCVGPLAYGWADVTEGGLVDHDQLASMLRQHPGWRLLRAGNAVFVAAVLHRVFVAGNARTVTEADLLEAVDDALYQQRQLEPGALPRTAKEYVTEWASPEKGWLRSFYPAGSDLPSYDLTPSAEKALAWLESLTQRTFVGTESRLLTVFALLHQIVEQSQDDPAERLVALHRRRAEIDQEIARVENGQLTVLDNTAVRDRFQQFASTSRELLSDFREVEDNFRSLDRGVREQIAAWDGARGTLLDEVLGEREAIAGSDQGVSFRAFYDFLMAADRQDEFDRLLDAALALPALRDADPALRYVVADWLRAAGAVQATVAQLSHQLRRFLDDRAYLENRRIAELMRSIEAHALRLRDDQPAGAVMEIDESKADVWLPMSRRLYSPPARITLDNAPVETGDEDVPTDELFDLVTVDPQRLREAVSLTLRGRDQATLGQVLAEHPVEQGLAEVVTYLAVADGDSHAVFHPSESEPVSWESPTGPVASEVPLVIFTGGPDE
jgi:hypothetical protein